MLQIILTRMESVAAAWMRLHFKSLARSRNKSTTLACLLSFEWSGTTCI